MRRRYVGIFPEKLICQKYNGNVNKINKNIAFVLEVFAGFFFIIAIMVVVFF